MKWNTIVVLVAATAATAWVYQARASRHPASAGGDVTWMTDANAALTLARTENRDVLLDFTGSDWCGWCIKLDKEVFSTADFAEYARQHLVLLKVDFPRHEYRSAAVQKQNEALMQKYGIAGYPTIVVLRPNGTERGRLGYQPGGAGPWLSALKRLK